MIVDNFSGQSTWRAMKGLIRPFAKRFGFRLGSNVARHSLRLSWSGLAVALIKPLNLPNLVRAKNVR